MHARWSAMSAGKRSTSFRLPRLRRPGARALSARPSVPSPDHRLARRRGGHHPRRPQAVLSAALCPGQCLPVPGGRFRAGAAKRLIKKYFGPLRSGPPAAAVRPIVPALAHPRRIALTDRVSHAHVAPGLANGGRQSPRRGRSRRPGHCPRRRLPPEPPFPRARFTTTRSRHRQRATTPRVCWRAPSRSIFSRDPARTSTSWSGVPTRRSSV